DVAAWRIGRRKGDRAGSCQRVASGLCSAAVSRFRPLENVPSWRTLALHAWGRPSDPSVYGIIDVPIGAAQAFLARTRDASGSKVTLTHLVGKAVALAIAE